MCLDTSVVVALAAAEVVLEAVTLEVDEEEAATEEPAEVTEAAEVAGDPDVAEDADALEDTVLAPFAEVHPALTVTVLYAV